MKRLFAFALFASFLANSSMASSPLALSLDVAQFRGSDKQNYLEIYYSMPEMAPSYVKNADEPYTCSVLFNLHIFQDDTLWATKVWRINNTLADTAKKENGKQLVDLIRYPVEAGHPYLIKLFVKDISDGRIDSVQAEYTSANFNAETVCLSDLQLASTIQAFDSTCSESFHKRFYCVLPNPEMTYGEKATDLHFYFEAYHLDTGLADGVFRVRTRILDNQGNPTASVPAVENVRPKRQEMIREIGQFSTANLRSGIYALEYSVLDSSGTIKAQRSKMFLVQNPSIKEMAAVFGDDQSVMTFLDGLSAAALDQEFDKLYPISKKEEREIFRSMKEADAKRAYLYNYWRASKPPAYANVEAFRRDYLEQAAYVNNTYAMRSRPGWKTDRGMIYLRYGRPSDIERHTLGQDTNPYEIWRYDQYEGGVIFVFVDRIGFNQYELIHSTKRGELYDPNYQRLLQPTSDQNFQM